MRIVRTGSVGNRSAEDMVNTLVQPKKQVISELRNRLLGAGFSEEVDYDSINVEPILIYKKSDGKMTIVRHKWELGAQLPVGSDSAWSKLTSSLPKVDLLKFVTIDDDKKRWLKFELPKDEGVLFDVLDNL